MPLWPFTKKKKEIQHQKFDLHVIADNLSQSVADRVYREFSPASKAAFDNRPAGVADDSPENDLLIRDDLIAEIKLKLENKISEQIEKTFAHEVERQLVDQYFPAGKKEQLVDKFVKFGNI